LKEKGRNCSNDAEKGEGGRGKAGSRTKQSGKSGRKERGGCLSFYSIGKEKREGSQCPLGERRSGESRGSKGGREENREKRRGEA